MSPKNQKTSGVLDAVYQVDSVLSKKQAWTGWCGRDGPWQTLVHLITSLYSSDFIPLFFTSIILFPIFGYFRYSLSTPLLADYFYNILSCTLHSSVSLLPSTLSLIKFCKAGQPLLQSLVWGVAEIVTIVSLCLFLG